MTTRFETRTFLICFVPVALLLVASFWLVQRFVESTVHDGLHNSLRESQIAIGTIHAKDLQNSQYLKTAGENGALNAAVQQIVSDPRSQLARKAVQDQLGQLCEQMGFDLMLVSVPDGTPLVGVIRQDRDKPESGRQFHPLDTGLLYHSDAGFRVLEGRTLQIASVSIDENSRNIGILSAGQYFHFSDLSTPVVLVHNGKVIESNIPQVSSDELERTLKSCKDQSECDLSLQNSNWTALPIQSYGGGYNLLSLENVDKATISIQSRLHSLIGTLLLVSIFIACLCSIGSSSNIVKPIAAVVSHLRNAVRTGVLSELQGQTSSILEIRELAEFYNQAAVSVRAAGENLESAYLEFVGSLANALDARDGYTAGHSLRVSQLSCAIASVMQLAPADIERLRIGALLHDIGKIGISDSVLRKPTRLTDEETELLKQHPVIGRRILEGVQGFAPFLAAVELHHENWDGSGYPHGQSGEETPIDARIIHVADSYDAMTTHRPYRRGLSHDEAIAELMEYAGTQFDPRIVEAFVSMPREILAIQAGQLPPVPYLKELAVAAAR